jgi:tRNA A37 threonylcarbamoyladenosine dehydratase
MSWDERSRLVLGDRTYEKITDHHVLIVGVGGVGGAVLEALARFGMKRITVIDFDTVDETNLNRQLISNRSNIGALKVDVAAERVLSINPDCDIKGINVFLNEENLTMIRDIQPDYVIDAIDSVRSKLDLIQFCRENGIPIVSSMGTGNRFSPEGFVIDKVENSAGNGCGLSRVMRRELRKRGIEGHVSLFNRFPPDSSRVRNSDGGRHAPGSTVFAPNAAGLLLASYVCRKLAE